MMFCRGQQESLPGTITGRAPQPQCGRRAAAATARLLLAALFLAASCLALAALLAGGSWSKLGGEAAVSPEVADAAAEPRQLQGPADGQLGSCAAAEKGFPVRGVLYVPHLVGEPYPRADSRPQGFYGEAYSSLHRRDLPLIGQYLGADTVLLRPWVLEDTRRMQIFRQMSSAGVCKVIPTFHFAKYYTDLLKSGSWQPDTDSSSPLFKDFVRFGGALASGSVGDVEVVGWTVDVSLDLESLLQGPMDRTCSLEPMTDPNYRRYKALLQVLVRWVRQGGFAGSVAPALRHVPLLVPLDVSRVSYSQPLVEEKLTNFLSCMSAWSPTLFGQAVRGFGSRWLLSFALPHNMEEDYNFPHWLGQIASTLNRQQVRAVVMLGAQALRPDPSNVAHLVEDHGNRTAPPTQQRLLQSAYEDYTRLRAVHGNLDGFLLDEWQDDWDRGARGPFYLARDNLDEMQGACLHGGRFSHDITRCARKVGNGYAYPEFFGVSGTDSQALQHCASPRFHVGTLFRFPGNASNFTNGTWSGPVPIHCQFIRPSFVSMASAAGLIGLIGTIQGCWIFCSFCCLRNQKRGSEEKDPKIRRERTVGYVTVTPQEPRLRGNHIIELSSTRMRSNEETGWWLWTHLSAQMSILEKQVMAEVSTRRALRQRRDVVKESGAPPREGVSSSALSTRSHGALLESVEDDLAAAIATIHCRVLEGFAAWCMYVSNSPLGPPSGVSKDELRELARMVNENHRRGITRLFVETLLLRVMESLGEQVLCCPERLSFLLYGVVTEAGGAGSDDTPATFSIDFEELQSGLDQMQFHSNPYKRKLMPDGKYERGLNFDDINESGIQCRQRVSKTYNEPTSIMVIIDFFLCYRAPFMIKLWTVFIAGYLYLGSGFGNDITTAHNGPWYKPRWLRVNFIQYVAMGDACAWVLIEVVLILYVGWQRWPSLRRRSPGVPNCVWLLEHLFNAAFSVVGAGTVFANSSFEVKPPQCRGLDLGECEDPRSSTYWQLFETLWPAGIYWVCRLVIFGLMHQKHNPIFIHGTPWRKTRKEAGRTCCSALANDLVVNLVWVGMLACCVLVEVYGLLPAMRGLSWNTTCGFAVLGSVPGLPEQVGTCSQEEHWLGFGCVTCVTSVVLAGSLTFLGCMVDIYFVFYAFSSVLGSVMGHSRRLNDLKNTSVPVDLRPQAGREAKLFEHVFGPGWQQVWLAMGRHLLSESYISPKHFSCLMEAAGITEDGHELVARREKRMKPIQLSRFPHLAAERLAFFFHSLEWFEKPSGPARGSHFEQSTDALTGDDFDPGTIPSLTQIIPAYSENVIPSVDFLRAGALPEDAMNQSPEGQPGVGDMTDPPRGDGINTNLAFMISQFPDEWSFLAKRLHYEGQLADPNAHELYKCFVKQTLREELVVEVRLWASLRCQSIAKTVIGALQYQRALEALPKIREYYAERPDKRLPEDHAEVILAHQTYGQNPPEGNPENDEAVRLLLMRYGHESLVLVFDLTPASNENVWRLVEAFLRRRGGYDMGGFEYASVKCRWDAALRDLKVLEVLPRKFPLRLGKGDFKTQGKACNQLNGLRFATGHYVQALDCNMGCFIGEGFKMPYVLRVFMPLDQADRTVTRCRYLGFREYIFTGREGTVGKCHAAAEWTFGTIYQRFLSGMGTRMHYGHPDFVDGFWARNRGGMSKCSPVVNLSEDIFAGYNVRMRGEPSPHIDALEFEKGRESTFNAASNFFSKISGGSIAVMRSRDNHLLCERIGIFHSLSFYFTSVAFYVSNLIVDISIYIYVLLFVVFTLANIDLGRLSRLGSSFSTEWIVSMGIVSLVPQLLEMILEYGAIHAIKEAVGGFFAATWFFIFQNKNISSAMRNGATTGIAKYFFTGRPMANQHQTWRDIYVTYSKSHYQPAFVLVTAYLVYNILVLESFQGKLPMLLIVISITAWLITPIIFNPFPRWTLIEQDLKEFNGFINGRAGMDKQDLAEVVDRGQKGRVRTLFEAGLADEISVFTEQPPFVLLLNVAIRAAVGLLLALSLPAALLDFVWIYVVVLSCQWVLVFLFFTFNQNNILLILSFLIWPFALLAGHFVIGQRASNPGVFSRLPEYFISFIVFLYLLGLAKRCMLVCSRFLYCSRLWCSPGAEKLLKARFQESIRLAYVYFFVHQLHCVEAYLVLIANTVVSLVLVLVDLLPGRPHTWWLLNNELARTKRRDQYLEKQPTFLELEGQRWGQSSSGSSCGTDSDDGSSETATSVPSNTHLVANERG